MKIIIASRNKVLPFGTTQLRCIQPSEYLNSLEFDVTITELTNYIPNSEDILILHRVTGNMYNKSLVELAQANKTKVLYDTDDLIFHSEGIKYLSKLGLKKYSKEKDGIKSLMANCDAVSVSTSVLDYYAKAINPNTFLIKNALSYSFIKEAKENIKEKKDNDKVIIAYLSGSATHDRDFQVISATLFKILTNYPQTQLLIIGPLKLEEKFFAFKNQVVIKEFMPYKEFQKVFNEIDINLIPLEVSEKFCQCKSELKFIEAGAFSIPSIASPTAPHIEAINNGVNGLLSKDNEWYENIVKLLDSRTRKKMGEMALKTVIELYSPTTREKDWNKLLQTIQKLESKPLPKYKIFIKLKFNIYKKIAVFYEKQKKWERYIRTNLTKK